jgi:hypothetical protein
MTAAEVHDLDAHEQPSDGMRAAWKSFSKADHVQLLSNPDIDDPRSPDQASEFRQAGTIHASVLREAFSHIQADGVLGEQTLQDAPIYFHPLLPGQSAKPSISHCF